MELVSKFGREKEYVRNASKATHMLSSLARCCHRQIRLGRGSPDVEQKGISGNSIFFAQPTATIPCMELPPPDDALVDSLNIVFTRNVDNLDNAHWATVKREEYLKIVRERKQQCPAFTDDVINEEAAPQRLPENGVPAAVLHCVQQVDGADKAPVIWMDPRLKRQKLAKTRAMQAMTPTSTLKPTKDAMRLTLLSLILSTCSTT